MKIYSDRIITFLKNDYSSRTFKYSEADEYALQAIINYNQSMILEYYNLSSEDRRIIDDIVKG